MNREVALKFLPQVLAGDNIVLDELRRETLRCLDLSHHHIVRVYGLELGDAGTGAAGKLAAIHMEFVDGLTLRELMHKRVKEEGKPPVFEVREITAWVDQLCDALHYAHTKAKLAHRDLKPSNIMVNSAGEAKLADFGVARKIVDNLAQVTNLIVGTGTTAYMSPQQMNGGVPHPTDDVYSLGATIYELLTSKPPFFSGDMRHQVTQVAPPTMTERREQLSFTGLEAIPEVWEQVVAQCLSKNPEERPQSCEEVAKLLKGQATKPAVTAAAKNPPTSRPAQPAAAPTPAETRKGPPLLPMAAGVVVLLALAGGGIWWNGQKDKAGQSAPAPQAPVAPAPAAPVAPAPVAPAMPAFGTLNITSEPPGAEVIFDGKVRFKTPSLRTNVPTGPHTLLVSLPNHEDEIREFALTNVGPLDVKIVLKRLSGQVSIESKPDKSAFVLKGTGSDAFELRGQTPFKTNLALGRYTVTLARPGHTDKVENLTVEAGGSHSVSYEFPLGGMLLESTPPGLAFEVFRGPTRLFAGVTPTNFTDLPAGSYRVTMKRDGFAPFDDTVAVLKSLLTPMKWNSTDNVVRGAFSLATTPANASAIIEGQAPRYTPALFTGLTPGKYQVTLRLDGYEPATREIEVKGGATNAQPVLALARSTGTLQLASTPASLAYEIKPVSVLGEASAAPKRGSTKAAAEPHALPTGVYEVRVQRPGWPEFVKEVTLARGQSFSLAPEFPEGTLEVSIQPPHGETFPERPARHEVPRRAAARAARNRREPRHVARARHQRRPRQRPKPETPAHVPRHRRPHGRTVRRGSLRGWRLAREGQPHAATRGLAAGHGQFRGPPRWPPNQGRQCLREGWRTRRFQTHPRQGRRTQARCKTTRTCTQTRARSESGHACSRACSRTRTRAGTEGRPQTRRRPRQWSPAAREQPAHGIRGRARRERIDVRPRDARGGLQRVREGEGNWLGTDGGAGRHAPGRERGLATGARLLHMAHRA